MFRSTIFRLTAAAAVLLVLFFAGCSDDDCATCPAPTAGVTLSSQVMTPQPFPSYYSAVFAAGPQDIFIAADLGVILRRQGTTWTTYDTGVVSNFRDIWGTSSSDVWAVGASGTIVHFDGSGWQVMDSGVLDALHGVHGTGPDDVYAVGTNATLLHYDGSRWSRITPASPTEDRSFRDIWCAPTGQLFIALSLHVSPYNGAMLVYDGRLTWTETPLGSRSMDCVWGTALNNVWAGNSDGEIHHWEGATWSHRHTVPDYVTDIHGTAANDVWAVGAFYTGSSGGTITHYDGSTWSPAGHMVNPPPFQGVAAAGGMEVYVIGSSSTVFSWNGRDWNLVNDEWVTDNHLQTMWGASENDFWSIASNGSAIHYDGAGWTEEYAGSEIHLNAMWGSASNNIYAVGGRGTIVRYNGTSWSEVTHGLGTTYLRQIWGSGPNDIWVGTDRGQMWHFDGRLWSVVDVWPPEYGYASSLWGVASDDFYAVNGWGVMHYDGTSWNAVGLGGYKTAHVHGVSSNEVYFLTGPEAIPITSGETTAGAPPVAGSSALIRYDGSDYAVVASNVGARLDMLWALGPDNVFMAGESDLLPRPVVAHFDGSRLVLEEPDSHMWITDIWGTGSGTVFVCGGSGSVIRVTRN
jgi:hypothetical protein